MGSRGRIDLGMLGEWGNILAYRTNKTVLVRDKVLGPVYLATSVLIVLYIVYRIVFEKAYLDYEAVSGSVKLVLTGFSPGINMMREDYCHDMTCRLCDEHDVRYPNFDTREVLVTTYVREARQHRVCQRNATECPFKSPYQTVAWDDYLVAGIQHFSLNVEHSVQAPTFFFLTQNKRYRGSSRNMRGRLVSHKNGAVKVLKEFPANGEVDTVSIKEVLEAAGLDLDHVLPGHIRPIRMTGTIIECHIHYFNDYSFFAPANKIRCPLPSPHLHCLVHLGCSEKTWESVRRGNYTLLLLYSLSIVTSNSIPTILWIDMSMSSLREVGPSSRLTSQCTWALHGVSPSILKKECCSQEVASSLCGRKMAPSANSASVFCFSLSLPERFCLALFGAWGTLLH